MRGDYLESQENVKHEDIKLGRKPAIKQFPELDLVLG